MKEASSSSAASTVMGSPGAEKRGTRSPLPPLPQGDNSLYSAPSPQPPHSPPRSVPPAERPTQRALEEMYAKVMKKQRPGHSRGNSSGGGESDNGSESSSRRGSVDIGGGRWGSHHSTPPTTPRQSVDLGAMTHSLIETRNNDTSKSISRAKSYETASIWSGTSQQSQPLPKPNPNYETIPQHPGNFYSGGSDPGYETVKNSEPPYASVERPEENYPGYETVKPTSDIESEPGYETLKHREYEPGYETVTGEAKQTASEPGYETVASKTTQEDDEPGYETVAHQTEAADPGYETVKGKSTSEFGDPGYEELKSTVHHIRTTSEHDPNYEQLKFTSRRSSDGDAEPGYEVVKKVETESTYESVRDYDIPEKYPPYEKIDKTEKSEAQQTPVYASVVRKGSKSPDKKSPSKESPDADKDTGATGLLESDLDNLPPLEPKGELITIETRNENQNISVTTRVKTPSPVKSPSPPLKSPSPPLKESPVSSPEKVLPPEVPEVKSPEKSPPAMVKAEEKGSPTLDRSPDSESPCLTKSPDSMSEMSPEKEEVPFGIPPDTQRKSPSPPLHEDDSLAKDSLQGKSVKKDSSPEKAPESVFVLPEKGSPPSMKLFEKESPTILVTMEKDPSIDQDSSMIADSPEKETPPEVASADKETTEKVVCDVEDKESVSKDRDSLDETSSGTTGSPDKMPSSPLDSSPVIEEQPVGKSLLEELQESTETIETFSQPLPPAPDSKEMEEQSSSFQENPSLPPPLLIQDEPHPISSSIDECAVRENLPSPPPSQSPQRSSSPTTVDHFGSEPPLPLPETHAQPTETVNPLYVTDNGIPPIEPSAINENAADEGESHVSLCGELPPPPPPMEVDDTTFPNDLPPPLPEIAPLVNTLPEDTPPPLVPPADVEGLDDMLTLANMGSSSSGSTAVQLGSAHGSSEKDSESPQDNEGNQMEVVSVIDDLPPPPPPSDEPEAEQDSDEELDNSVSSGYELGFTAGGITVTVNPMADVTEKSESPDPIPPPPVSEPSQVVPPSPIAVSAIISSSTGSQSSSSGSGSQDTGSGSIESVVTVECAPPPPPGDVSGGGSEGISESQHSSESPSSPESRPLDPHEQITEV